MVGAPAGPAPGVLDVLLLDAGEPAHHVALATWRRGPPPRLRRARG
ncbi:hypothetical protein AB2L28_08705 [Kineococcus sp. TBRC 1896]|uniref:Uncharacterized protein n=1 Tax=Kineococcus mangrovi TaxID=1660183 RepID=A0ABV4I0X2_9ACTN